MAVRPIMIGADVEEIQHVLVSGRTGGISDVIPNGIGAWLQTEAKIRS